MRDKRSVIAICFFLAALLIHSLIIFHFLPPGQLLKYPGAASGVLKGSISGERLLDFSPLYLQVHVYSQILFSNSNHAIQWFHLLLIAFSVSFLFWILSQFFSVGIASAGAATFLFDRSVVIYTQAFEPEPILIFLILAFLILIIRKDRGSHIAAGVMLGLAFVTRPNFLPMLVIVPLYFYFRHPDRPSFIRSSIACCLPVLIALGVLWARNAAATGYFSPVFMNPGTTFYEGNNPISWGTSAMYPPLVNNVSSSYSGEYDYHHQIYRSFARKIAGTQLRLPEVNRFWITRSLNFLLDHPRHTLHLYAMKIFNMFHEFQWHDLPNAFWNEQKLRASMIPTVPFAIISALSLYGLWAARTRWKELLVFYGMFLSQLIVMMAVYVSARQRVAVISLFIFFACAAVSHLLTERKRWLYLLILVPLILMLYIRNDLMYEETRLWESNRFSKAWLDQGYRERSKGNLMEASENAARALAATPYYQELTRPSGLSFEPQGFAGSALKFIESEDASSLFDRAVLSIEAGKPADAEKLLKEVLKQGFRIKRDYYQSSSPYYFLGRAAMLQNNRNEAIENFKMALEQIPGDPWSLASLHVLTGEQTFKDSLYRYFDDIDAAFFTGQAALQNGAAEQAVESFEYAVKMVPEYRPAWIYLAAALGKAERYQEGSDRYQHAMKMKQEPVMLEKEILELYDGLLRSAPANPEYLQLKQQVYGQFGRKQ